MEKITSAFYLVSSLLPDLEPIKYCVRNDCVGALESILSLTPGEVSKTERLYALGVKLAKLSSQLDVLFVSGLVSEMNFRILKNELDLMLENIAFDQTSENITVGKKVTVGRDFFGVNPDQFIPGYSQEVSDVSAGMNSENEGHLVYTWSDAVKVQSEIVKRQIKDRGHKKDSSESSVISDKGHFDTSSSTVDRQSIIIDTLKVKDRLTVKDFSALIKGVSSKTIQRELLKLVSAGVLKKEGERRWSRYSLISA